MARYVRLWVAEEVHFHPERFPHLDSPSLFENDRPLEVEVGCGTGEWLCAEASERPQVNFLGIDPLTKVLFFAARSCEQAGLENVRLVRAPVGVLEPLWSPRSLDAVHIHFPDPFVRSRGQHKVLNAKFFEAMQRALKPGGSLRLVSDKPELFEEALKLAEATPGLEKAHSERYLVGFEPSVKTRYQKKWERYQVQPLRFEFRARPLPG